jgi:hypothetical protein
MGRPLGVTLETCAVTPSPDAGVVGSQVGQAVSGGIGWLLLWFVVGWPFGTVGDAVQC